MEEIKKVKIIFPSIHKGITIKKDESTTPYNYVSIVNSHAIVVTPYSVVCFNMREYFLNVLQIDDTENEAFHSLMNWMEGKFFTIEFWNYLTSLNDITVIDETRIKISGNRFQKELIYDSQIDFDTRGILKNLKTAFTGGKYQYARVGISNGILKNLDKTFGKIIQGNSLVFEMLGPDQPILFTVDNMDFIFGLILSSNKDAAKQFLFDGFKGFVNTIED
jgi:hypothetical protein